MSGPLGGDFFDSHCSNELHNVYSGLHVSIKHSETVKSSLYRSYIRNPLLAVK